MELENLMKTINDLKTKLLKELETSPQRVDAMWIAYTRGQINTYESIFKLLELRNEPTQAQS